jgi:hypothetical protein
MGAGVFGVSRSPECIRFILSPQRQLVEEVVTNCQGFLDRFLDPDRDQVKAEAISVLRKLLLTSIENTGNGLKAETLKCSLERLDGRQLRIVVQDCLKRVKRMYVNTAPS